MNIRDIQRELSSLGLYRGGIDGVEGPMTSAAIRSFQRLHPPLTVDGVAGPATIEELFTKKIEERCACAVNRVRETYGMPGQNLVNFTVPYKMVLAWETETTITKFQCHAKVVDYLDAIFKEVLSTFGMQKIRDLGLDQFGGCFNMRNMRGGDQLSMHAWGIAVDIDPVRNQLRWNKNKARLAQPDANKFWEIVEKHCGVSLGREKNYDWMHFQFAKVNY